MNIRLIRNDALQRIEMRASGPFALQDAVEALEQQLREGIWHYSQLVDARLVTGTVTFEDLYALREVVTRSGPRGERRGPLAVVVTDIALHRKACAYAMLTGARRPVDVFEDRAAAERWLCAQRREARSA